MSKLSLSMIVKNEEKQLSKCLDSVIDIVDEIIIVDTGSTDRTKEIAKSYGAKIFDFKWNSNFSDARNFSLGATSGDWVLYLDADEYLSLDSCNEISTIIKSEKKLLVKCKVQCIDDSSYSSVVMNYTRLFKKNTLVKFSGRVHEQIDDSLISLGYEFIDSNIIIYHTGYDAPEKTLMAKAERNVKLLLKDYSESKESYTAYQVGNSFNVLKEYEKAFHYFLKAIEKNDLALEYKIIAFTFLAGKAMQDYKFDDAKEYIDSAIGFGMEDVNLFLTAAQIYAKFDMLRESLLFCENALSLNNKLMNVKTNARLVTALINPLNIIYKGIYYSCLNSSDQHMSDFLAELESIEIKNENANRKREIVLLKKIISKSDLSKVELSEMAKYMNDSSIETYLLLLEQFLSVDKIIFLMESEVNRFSNNPDFLTQLGNAYLACEKFDKAQNEYEKILQLSNINPSVYFYLTSIYMQTHQQEQIVPLLNGAKEKFSGNKQIIDSFIELEKKISPII